MKSIGNLSWLLSSLTIGLILSLFVNTASSQQPDQIIELQKKANALVKQGNYVAALPILQQLVEADPNDANSHFELGFAYLAKAQLSNNDQEKMALRKLGRSEFLKAKALGSKEGLLEALIESIPPDGSLQVSGKPTAADRAMKNAEDAYAQGKNDEALRYYKKAHRLNPLLYTAPLYAGDVYVRKEDFVNAEIWYQKAININPYRETAYRYSATPLMKSRKYDAALERYVEAFIVEPYSRFASAGISNWGEVTKTGLGHPKIDIPKFKIDAKGKANSSIGLDPSNNDGSEAWIAYIATRLEWHEGKFAQTFPGAKKYRHSLKEEAESLRSVILIAKELERKKTKLNPQLETLIELDEKGLLEAFILMAIPDHGIAQDHASFLRTNRTILRRYVFEYVVIKSKR